MDPISSILTILSTAIDGLKWAKKFYKIPKEIDDLIQDIERFRAPLDDLEWKECQRSSKCNNFAPLLQIVEDIDRHILELNQLLAYDLKPLCKPSRISWLVKKSRVDRVKKLLQDAYLVLPSRLIQVNIRYTDQLGEKLDQAESKLEENSRLLEKLAAGQETLEIHVRTLAEQAPHKIRSRSLVQLNNLDTSKANDLGVHPIERVSRFSGIADSSHEEFIPSITRDGCHPYCDCSCHDRIHWMSPRMLAWFIGQLAINAPERALFSRKCNKLDCRQSVISSARMTYKLPLWMIKKGFLLLMSRQLSQGPEMLLRMQRIRPEDADVFWYASLNDVLQLKYLFETGQASPWDVTPTGETTLLISLKSRVYKITNYLLCQGADKDFENQDKMSAVSYVWYDFLINRPQPDNAVATEDKIYELFGETDFVHSEKFGKLHREVAGFEIDGLENAICSGTIGDLNAVDLHNRTPLYWAAVRGDVEKVKLLLHYGASPHVGQEIYPEVLRCIDVYSPFDENTRNLDLLEVTSILRSVGACNDSQGPSAFTLMHIAAQHNEGCLLIDSFIDETFNLSLRNAGGLTPLDHACISGMPENVAKLVTCGADVNFCDVLHVPSIFYAIDRRDVESIEILLKAGAKLDYVNVMDEYDSGTILHKIAICPDESVTDFFIGANDLSSMPDPEQRNRRGETPVELFLSHHHEHRLFNFQALYTKFIALLERTRVCRVPSKTEPVHTKYFQLPGSWPQESDPDWDPIQETPLERGCEDNDDKIEEEKDTDKCTRDNIDDGGEVVPIDRGFQRNSLSDGRVITEYHEGVDITKYTEEILEC